MIFPQVSEVSVSLLIISVQTKLHMTATLQTLTQPGDHGKKFKLYFFYYICNPQKFKGWPLAELVTCFWNGYVKKNTFYARPAKHPNVEYFFSDHITSSICYHNFLPTSSLIPWWRKLPRSAPGALRSYIHTNTSTV